MAKVKRYTCGNGDGMFEDDNGNYVEHKEVKDIRDYAIGYLMAMAFDKSEVETELKVVIKELEKL